MPRKRTRELKRPVSDMALIVWLMDAPYIIMKALGEGSTNATEVADKLGGKPIAWVSKRTSRMVMLGLISKAEADDNGFCKIELTEKGVRVLRAIEGVERNPLFIELKRALDLTPPGEDERSAIRNEAARIKKVLTSSDTERPDIDRLFELVQHASSAKVEGWYACDDLTWLFSNVASGRWDEPSRLLLVRMIGMAMKAGRTDGEYTMAFNGLIEPLRQLASDDDTNVEIRAGAISDIGVLRDRDGKVPDDALASMILIQRDMLSPKRKGRDLIEGAVSEALRGWASLLNGVQKEMLFDSVRTMQDVRALYPDDSVDKDGESDKRDMEGMLNKYRSLVASIIDRDVPKY